MKKNIIYFILFSIFISCEKSNNTDPIDTGNMVTTGS